MNRYWSFLILALSLFATLWVYAYGELGAEVLNQPAVTINGAPFSGAAAMIVYILLVSGLYGLLWSKLVDWLPPFNGSRKTVHLCATGSLCLFWLYGAYSIACDYAFYFGSTWLPSEIFLGFVLTSYWALPLMMLCSACYFILYFQAEAKVCSPSLPEASA